MPQILLIEDDPLMSELYERVFKDAGYEVILAVDGSDGFHKAKEQLPTIILLDIIMPKMDGIQALELLKSNPSTSLIPVIILTNVSTPLERDRAMSLGAIDYVVKSNIDPKNLVEMIKKVIETTTPQPS